MTIKILTKSHFISLIFFILPYFSFGQKDTSQITFSGHNEQIKYTVNRKISEAQFELKNNTKSEITIKAGNAYLIRGKSSEVLEKVAMKVYYKNKVRKLDEFILRPRQKINIYYTFKPFIIYTGTDYTVMAEIYIGETKWKATTVFELQQLEKNDKNSLKNSDK